MIGKIRKGLHDIPSRSSLTSEVEAPQRKFLRAASLELKKSLCRKVRDAARTRAEEMERKIAELDAEQAQLLAAGQVSEPAQPGRLPALHLARDLGADRRRGFPLKY